MNMWQHRPLSRRQISANKCRAALAAAALLVMTLSARSAHALDPSRLLTQYGHTAWLLQDGELPGPVYPIAQTRDGYLWIGTQAGVVRFDGVRFVPLEKLAGKSLADPFVTSLRGAGDGSLWIATLKGLERWQSGELTLLYEAPSFNIDEDERGTIWFWGLDGERESLCAGEGFRVHCYDKQDGLVLPSHCNGSMITDRKGTFWISCSGEVVRWRSGAHSETFPVEAVAKGGVISNLFTVVDTSGALWVGVSAPGSGLGLQRLMNGTWERFVRPEIDGSTMSVQAIFRDREGAIWVGTIDRGVYRILPNRVDHFDSKDGLSSDSIYWMFEDAAGSMWITTSKGLDRLRELTVASFTTREGLSVDEVDSVYASRNGTVWVGTALTLDMLNHGRVRSMGAAQGLPGSQVTALLEDDQSRLWLGVDNTLAIYADGKFHQVPGKDGKPLGFVGALAQDKQGDVWAAVRSDPRKIVRLRNDRVVEELATPSSPVASSLSADPVDGIWIGGRDGNLARLRSSGIESFATGVNRPITQIIARTADEVYGTSKKGLVVLKHGAVHVLGAINGLPCDEVDGFVEDDRQAFWLQMACGIVKVERTELEHSLKDPRQVMRVKVLDVLDGVRSGFAPFGQPVRTPDGQLWFGNGANLQTLDPRRTGGTTEPLPIYVEQVVADHRTMHPVSARLTLPALTRDLQIDYTAIDLAVPQRLRFRYRLDGRDQDWTEAQQRRQAFFTNLPQGDYRFRVAVSRGNGVWHEMTDSLQFAILPAFYQTHWFRVLIGVLCIGILWWAYVLRVSIVTARERSRMRAITFERERIARDLHDTLLQGLASASLQLEVADRQIPTDANAKPLIQRVTQLLRQLVDESRGAVRHLRLQSSEEEDLERALTQIAIDLAAPRHVKHHLVVEGGRRPLRPLVREEIFRIAGEALANAFRHSDASTVETVLEYGRDYVRLLVRDDGKGIDPEILSAGREGHFGLSGLRERASRIGALLNIRTGAGAGTEIDLRVPAAAAFERPSPGGLAQWVAKLYRRGASQ